MTHFVLSGRARRDVAGVIGYLHTQVGPGAADAFERELFATLRELVRLDGPGHRRPDLTAKNILFEFMRPYFIIFRKSGNVLHVTRVLHSSRDISKLL